MERLRSFIKSAFSYPRLLLETHPVTTVSIMATTVLFAVYTFILAALDYAVRKRMTTPMDIFMHISLAVLFFSVFALCLESIRPHWKRGVKLAVFAAFALLSLFMSFISADFLDRSRARLWGVMLMIRDSLGSVTIFLYIGGLLAIALLLAIYFSYSHDVRQPFNEHILGANSNIFFTSIIYGVIQCGVIFLTVIVMLLLYDDAFEYLGSILILINGIFYAPAMVCAITRENEKANIFFQILVRYIMLTIVVMAYAIIYIYMIKLVVTASVPSNSVYAILTTLFIISMFVSYICTTFESKGFLQKFAYNAPLIFAPFVLMQCYTVFVRIGQYGLTPKRYFGIAFIVFEIIYIVYYTVSLRREHEIAGRNLILIICAIIVAVIFIPGINARSLSIATAKRTLNSYFEKVSASATISDREYMHASAAYDFLNDDGFGEGKVEKYFSGIDEGTVDALHEMARTAAKNLSAKDGYPSGIESSSYPRSAWFAAELWELAGSDRIDISGYNTLLSVNIQDNDRDYDSTDNTVVDPSKLDVFLYDGNGYEIRDDAKPYMNVDLSGLCEKLIDLNDRNEDNILDYDEFQEKCRSLCIVDIDENARLYITNADISYNEKAQPVNINLTGYLFTK